MIFTIFDICILSVITISSLFCLYKGSINIIINSLGLIGSIIGAIFIYPYVKSLLSSYIVSELFLSIVSGIIAYILSLIGFAFISSRIIALFSKISCGFFDRLLGLIIGFIRGVFFAVIIFTIIAIFFTRSYVESKNVSELIFKINIEKYPSWLLSSKTMPYLQVILDSTVGTLPQDWLKSLELTQPWNGEEEEDSH